MAETAQLAKVGSNPDRELHMAIATDVGACFGLHANCNGLVNDGVEACMIEAGSAGVLSRLEISEPRRKQVRGTEYVCEIDHFAGILYSLRCRRNQILRFDPGGGSSGELLSALSECIEV